MPRTPSVRTIERFSKTINNELQPQLETVEQTSRRIERIRRIALAATNAVHLDWGLDLPHPDISYALLQASVVKSSAIEWLSHKIEHDDALGCWMLPLKEEFDSKNRARYPTLSSVQFEAKGELAHRFVVRRLIGPLDSQEHIDHICRRHACCNISHFDIVTHTTNVRRGSAARRSVSGQTRMF